MNRKYVALFTALMFLVAAVASSAPTSFTSDDTAKIQAAAVEFASEHPRFARAVNKNRLTFREADAAFRDPDLLSRFEARQATLADLRAAATQPRAQGDCYYDCGIQAQIYFDGCMSGGGSQFYCFFASEYYRCTCESLRCDPSKVCGGF